MRSWGRVSRIAGWSVLCLIVLTIAGYAALSPTWKTAVLFQKNTGLSSFQFVELHEAISRLTHKEPISDKEWGVLDRNCSSPHSEFRILAISFLRLLDGSRYQAQAHVRLKEATRDPDEDIRATALTQLALTNDAEIGAFIAKGLSDPNEAVRKRAEFLKKRSDALNGKGPMPHLDSPWRLHPSSGRP